ncbi:MAG: peptidylprolyl isomerase [Planctomycetota bacterium]|nr:peptidylprolyl isomerase [Planctomycetota bacterium]
MRSAGWIAGVLSVVACCGGVGLAEMGTSPGVVEQPSTAKPSSQPEQPAAKPGEAKPETPQAPAKERYVYMRMTTTLGEIVLELDSEKAPLSVANFEKYASEGHYAGTIFHRVIPGFMVQGGGFTADMNQKKTNPPIKNEWKNGLKNVRGSIAMARTNVADSATSQFFINVKDNGFLDEPRDGAGYAVFGRVVRGMDVVDKIVGVKTTTRRGMGDVPEAPITIERVEKMSAEDGAKAKAGT